MALRLCLERLIPPRKDRPINLRLPKIADVGDIPKALEGFESLGHWGDNPTGRTKCGGHDRGISQGD